LEDNVGFSAGRNNAIRYRSSPCFIDAFATIRLAICQWMTRGATKNAPDRPSLPANLSRLSNQDFVKALAEMGINPNLSRLEY
jgi:hypothetical protein